MAKIKKRTLRVLGTIFVILVVLTLVVNSIVAKILEKKIDPFLVKEHLKNYHITYSRVGFNILNRSVSLTGFKFLPDSSFLDSLNKTGYNYIVPEIKVRKLVVAGINFRAVLKDNNWIIRKITIKKPLIKLYKLNGKQLPSEQVAGKRHGNISVGDSVKVPGITGLSIGTIHFKESRLEFYNYKEKKYSLTNKDIEIIMHGLNLKTSRHNNNFFYPSLQDASLKMKDNILKLNSNLYEIAFQQLKMDLKDQTLIFKGFHFRPLYSKTEFSKHIKFQQERFDMKADEITFTGAEFYRFLTENEIRIKKIVILNPTINLFRDKRVPFDHSRRPLLPIQMLKKMKSKVRIDTVRINNARFDYGEKTNLTSQTLTVNFSRLSGTITHITNFSSFWEKNNSMKVNLRGNIMKEAPLDVQIIFPLAARSDTFFFKADIYGPIPLSIFNPAIFPAAGLKFNGGVLDSLMLKGNANTTYSSGTMKMLYHNLDLFVMKKDERTKNTFLSWGVNSFIRKNNPRKGVNKKPKVVMMFFERNMEKGFGNFFWKTTFSGLKATMIPSINTINRKNFQSITQTKAEPGKPQHKAKRK